MKRQVSSALTAMGLLAAVVSCGEPSEAQHVELPVRVDTTGVVPVTTDLGYEVEVSSVKVALNDIVFTIAGEEHATRWQRAADSLLDSAYALAIPSAHAHPGHYQGGEVTGELPGEFLVDWSAAAPDASEDEAQVLGVATLIVGTYSAANFTFGRGSADTLPEGDPLIGHTALLTGSATKEGEAIEFTIVVDSPEGRELVGTPFEAALRASAMGEIRFRFDTFDAFDNDTVFDGIDFAALDTDEDGVVRIAPGINEVEDAYNIFRRAFQTHDHFRFSYSE